MLKKFALTALLAMFPLSAFAGSLTQEDDDFMRYESNLGYTAKIPVGWTRLDASVVKAVGTNLPKNIVPKSLGQVDVIFYPLITDPVTTLEADNKRIEANKTAEKKADPVIEEPADQDYAPTITVSLLKKYSDAIDHPKNKTAVFKDELKKYLEDKNSVPFSEPEITSATYDEDLESYIFKYTLKNKINKIKKLFEVEQYLHITPSSKKVYVVTCTKYEDENELDEKLVVNSNWCKDFVHSLEFK